MHAATPTWTTLFLDFDAESYDRAVAFWQGVTGYGRSPMRGIHGELATLVPPDGDPHLRVQRLGPNALPGGESRGGARRSGAGDGPNALPGGESRGGARRSGAGDGTAATRVHLDVHVVDVDAAVPAAEELGALVTARRDGFVVLASPGGFPFCLVPSGESVRTEPAQWPDGQWSIVDQLCLDIPPRCYGVEAAFWRDLTGWESTAPTESTEFGSLRRPADQPVRILLQRLDDDQDGVTGHLDLAATDRDTEVARHVRLGARTIRSTSEWTVLADPTGWIYCVTDRDPETGVSARR